MLIQIPFATLVPNWISGTKPGWNMVAFGTTSQRVTWSCFAMMSPKVQRVRFSVLSKDLTRSLLRLETTIASRLDGASAVRFCDGHSHGSLDRLVTDPSLVKLLLSLVVLRWGKLFSCKSMAAINAALRCLLLFTVSGWHIEPLGRMCCPVHLHQFA
jgi:hypothetical protein